MKLLNELLDKPLEYQIENIDRDGQSFATFTLNDNEYTVALDWDNNQLDHFLKYYENADGAKKIMDDIGDHKNWYHLYFEMEGGTEMTYRGEAVKVLSTVTKAALDIIHRINPNVIYFTSDDESKSRSMVYQRLLRKFNYKNLHTFTNAWGEETFVVIL